ncbi:spore coat associated protein CotJA [Bacillus cereus]|uniref:Spore coat associated protein CotJA n=5 Tax=Bacillus TaxID=1386 RepID=A0A7V7S3U7_9BACI|nr:MULTISPECIES: spore coat associated protein CotJA [Bacillus]KAB2440538.1 spore coat associated protein CotJA [Bacillus luti]KMP73327.1 CotJA [Bacillus cereus]MBG9854867.1 CotJA [Bacillus wiedmannii]MCC2460928.1 spore coat associated protein CotJA [Bacillus mobilis]MCQ6542492.1 spore coat associated protein CotJA [Bacillus wiedmannii]
MDKFMKSYIPYHGPNDPCPPIGKKYYSTPPHLFMGFQPPNLPQFPPKEALRKGTLWPAFYDFYENPYKKGR